MKSILNSLVLFIRKIYFLKTNKLIFKAPDRSLPIITEPILANIRLNLSVVEVSLSEENGACNSFVSSEGDLIQIKPDRKLQNNNSLSLYGDTAIDIDVISTTISDEEINFGGLDWITFLEGQNFLLVHLGQFNASNNIFCKLTASLSFDLSKPNFSLLFFANLTIECSEDGFFWKKLVSFILPLYWRKGLSATAEILQDDCFCLPQKAILRLQLTKIC